MSISDLIVANCWSTIINFSTTKLYCSLTNVRSICFQMQQRIRQIFFQKCHHYQYPSTQAATSNAFVASQRYLFLCIFSIILLFSIIGVYYVNASISCFVVQRTKRSADKAKSKVWKTKKVLRGSYKVVRRERFANFQPKTAAEAIELSACYTKCKPVGIWWNIYWRRDHRIGKNQPWGEIGFYICSEDNFLFVQRLWTTRCAHTKKTN